MRGVVATWWLWNFLKMAVVDEWAKNGAKRGWKTGLSFHAPSMDKMGVSSIFSATELLSGHLKNPRGFACF